MNLIVGLGNPGNEFINTRHNVGFMVMDELADRTNATWSKANHAEALVAKIELAGDHAVLAKPQTFMNLSGAAVQALSAFFKINLDDIWVTHDEIDLPFGVLRQRVGGDSAGHNGVKSVIEHLGTDQFGRFRIGVANESLRHRIPADRFVLQPFNEAEHEEVDRIVKGAASAVLLAFSSRQFYHQDINLID